MDSAETPPLQDQWYASVNIVNIRKMTKMFSLQSPSRSGNMMESDGLSLEQVVSDGYNYFANKLGQIRLVNEDNGQFSVF